MSSSAFVVVSMSSWVADDFMPGLHEDQTLIRDYGWEIPQKILDYDSVLWWMPAAHAARVQQAGYAIQLLAPGAAWLTTLPESLTQRPIFYSDVRSFRLATPTQNIFIKPAEAKIDGFEAAWRTPDEALEIINNTNLPEDSFLQWTSRLLNLNHEHRFYVLDGKVLTGSAYLVDGMTYYDGAISPLSDAAEYFAQKSVDSITQQPAAYTLDVGYDEFSHSWVVIEGNPAWCSGLYGADPALALLVIERACNPLEKDVDFLWKPDASLVETSLKKVLLTVR